MKALIFDCDGVIADTERDGHRVAFNEAFAQRGYDFQWDVALYGRLLEISGGKERMRTWFNERGWPPEAGDRDAFLKELHRQKTDLYLAMAEGGKLPLRPGVKRLVDEAIAAGVILAVCSTSNERSVNGIVEALLGPERKAEFAGIFAGDMAKLKKPDPAIYNLAKERLSLNGEECAVIEDSRNGLLAAKAAGMYCVVTTNGYTVNEDFTEADAVVPELGDPPNVKITLEDLQRIAAGQRPHQKRRS